MDNLQASNSPLQQSPSPGRAASSVADEGHEAPASPIVHCSCIAHRSLQLVICKQDAAIVFAEGSAELGKRTDHKFVLEIHEF